MRLRRTIRWLRQITRPLLRAGVALLMITSLGLANFGYPVWEVAVKKGDVPFPCQFSRCGCQTAEQCRTSCCCHSKRERVAWAVAHNVDPDRVAILTSEEKAQFSFAAKFSLAANKRGCCQSKTAQASCCAQQQVASCCESQRVDAAAADKAELRWVLSIAANKCKGTGVEWIQAGFVAQPPPRVTLVIEPMAAPLAGDALPVYYSPAQEPLLRPV